MKFGNWSLGGLLSVLIVLGGGWWVSAQNLPVKPVFLQNELVVRPIDEPATSIFLTFDDGPTPGVTQEIVRVLDKYGAFGNFFVIGQNAERSWAQRLMARMAASGHLIANHTFEHSSTYADEAAFEASLRQTTELIKPHLPPSKLIFFRSPGGTWNASRARWTNLSRSGTPDLEFAAYVGPIFWNAGGDLVESNGQTLEHADWVCWRDDVTPRACADGYLAKIKANQNRGVPSVVLMHDLNVKTAEMLDLLLFDLFVDPTLYQFKRLDMAIWPFSPASL